MARQGQARLLEPPELLTWIGKREVCQACAPGYREHLADRSTKAQREAREEIAHYTDPTRSAGPRAHPPSAR